jgi:CRISPR/Cas system CMR-associated protein Cmr1 (group 7 of RAMP superfamily)
MKIHNLTFILILSVILSGLIAVGYVSIHDKAGYVSVYDKEETSKLGSQNQAQASESHATAPISKGTILLLLAVGVVGALGVSRTRKGNGSLAQRNKTSGASDYQNANKNRQNLIPKSP